MRRVQQYRHVLWLRSIAAEESLTGRLSSLNRARSSRNSLSLPQAHQDLADALVAIHAFPLLVYSEEAEAIFRTFPPATLRIGPQDCRIAAQALAHNLYSHSRESSVSQTGRSAGMRKTPSERIRPSANTFSLKSIMRYRIPASCLATIVAATRVTRTGV